MKSESMIAKWVEALLGAGLLLGAGMAQAALSNCTAITPAAPSVMLGSPSPLLTATCNNSPYPTGYKWKVDNALLATCTGSTCTVPATSLPAAATYAVTVTNNNVDGTGTVAASATITVTPVPADCLLTYGPVVDLVDPAVSASGKKVTLTANCNPGADRSTAANYAWTAGGNPVAVAANGAAAQAGEIINSPPGTAGPNTGSTITIAPPLDGTQFQVSNNTTVNSPRNSGAFYSGAPSCTLESVSPTVSGAAVTINSGASAVLLPTCDAATSIDWFIDIPNAADINIPAPAGGAVSPAATTAYYVVGNNAYGSSGSNVVTVTVNPPAPALPVPLCSLTASPLTISINDSTTLTATCPGATSFNWGGTAGNGAPATSTTSTIAVTPTSSGAKTYTVTGTNGSGTSAAASVIVNVSALPLSACTAITPASPSVTVGSASPLLSATCSNSPTSYVWKVGATTLVACTGATCTVPAANLPAAGTYNVTVTANNANGSGTVSATATISASQPSVAAAPVISAATAGSGSITVAFTLGSLNGGTLVNHQAVCQDASKNYKWAVGTRSPIMVTGLVNGTAYSCFVRTQTNVGWGGWSAKSIPATPTPNATPLSACTAITPATASVAMGSPSPLLTAACNNTPTAYAWKVGTATLACTGAACTVPAANLPAAGTYAVTVTANNAGGAGTQAASASITVSSAAPISCPQTWILEKTFDFKVSGQTQFMTIKRGQASAIKFTTGSDLTKKGSIATALSSQGPEVAKFMNISTSKCDFNYANLTNGTYCATTRPLSATLAYTLGAPAVGRCKLQPNTTYYVNIRNEDARFTTTRGIDTCVGTANCAFAAVLGN